MVYSCSEWDASEEPSDCSVELRVSRPNWLCTEKEEVLKKLYVPLTQLDIEGTYMYIEHEWYSTIIHIYTACENNNFPQI